MLQICYEQWGQTADSLRDQALNSPHPRTRERFLALFEITCGKNATQISRETGRNHQTVMGWVHRYNQTGPKACCTAVLVAASPFFAQKSPKG